MNLRNLFIGKYQRYFLLIFGLFFINHSITNLSIKAGSHDIKSLKKVSINSKNNSNLMSEYILGPGDAIGIDFKGLDIFTNNYLINPEGYLLLPEIQNIYAKGLTLKELKEKLETKYEKIIIDIKLVLSILKYRPVTVFISGEVTRPGLHKLNYLKNSNNLLLDRNISLANQFNPMPYSNISSAPKLFDALQNAGGVTNSADLSNILVKRINSNSQGGGEISANIDLLSLLIKGNQSQNIRILDGDHIIVPKSNQKIKEQILAINKTNLNPDFITVYITGNVVKVGPAKMKKGSSLLQAVASNGGKKLMTGNVEFIRFRDDGTSLKSKFRYDSNAQISSIKNPILMDGDIINIKRTILGDAAIVVGEVSSPILSGYGLYSIFNN